jgi:hypothetical protein
MKSLFEEMGGTYTLGADGMYYPDLALPEEEPYYGKYGRMRLRYLKEHRKVLYNTLLLDRELAILKLQKKCLEMDGLFVFIKNAPFQ